MEKFKEYKREFTDEEMVLHAWDKEMIQNTVSRFVNYWGNGDTAEAIDELWVKEPEHTADASFGTNTGFYVGLDEVRRHLVSQQQAMGRDGGVVMDGRDIGTVVFPHAQLKVFVTASAEVRAQRRYDELRSKGDTTTSYEEVLHNVNERDRLDTTREESPLRRADDAIELDNSNLTREEQNEWLYQQFEQALKRAKAKKKK